MPTCFLLAGLPPELTERIARLAEGVGATARSIPLEPHHAESFASEPTLQDAPAEATRCCHVVYDAEDGRRLLEPLRRSMQRSPRVTPLLAVVESARTRTTVDLMRHGVAAVVEPGAGEEEIGERLKQLDRLSEQWSRWSRRTRSVTENLGGLSEGEYEVLKLILEGLPNKTIARRLDVSQRTVEARRQRVFQKLECPSLAALIRELAETVGISPLLGEAPPQDEPEAPGLARSGPQVRPPHFPERRGSESGIPHPEEGTQTRR